MKITISTIFIILFSIFSKAQKNELTYIEYDTINNGYIEMSLDARMDDLLEKKKSRCDLINASRTTVTTSAPTENAPVKINDLCRENPWMRGYRIQVLNTRSSEEAEKAQVKIQSQFPHLSSKVVLRRPQFKLLLGDYFYKQNAAQDLNDVKKLYPGALLVASKIYCRRAAVML